LRQPREYGKKNCLPYTVSNKEVKDKFVPTKMNSLSKEEIPEQTLPLIFTQLLASHIWIKKLLSFEHATKIQTVFKGCSPKTRN
jgi:hypothetical protein